MLKNQFLSPDISLWDHSLETEFLRHPHRYALSSDQHLFSPIKHLYTSSDLKLDEPMALGGGCGKIGSYFHSSWLNLETLLSSVHQEVKEGADFVVVEVGDEDFNLDILQKLASQKNVHLRFSSRDLQLHPFRSLHFENPLEISLFERQGKLPWSKDISQALDALNTSGFKNSAKVHLHADFFRSHACDQGQELIFLFSVVKVIKEKYPSLEISVLFQVSSDFFLEIALVRSFQLLCLQSGYSGIEIQLGSNNYDLNALDTSTNILRGTMASFVGLVTGVDKIFVSPHDILTGVPTEASRRLARNTTLILKEECHLGRVQDPSRGSWYVESLVHDWVEKTRLESDLLKTWTDIASYFENKMPLFLEQKSFHQQEIDTRQRRLIGANDFVSLDALAEHVESPNIFRWAKPFEDIQLRAWNYAKKEGRKPKIFVMNVGPVSSYAARLQFVVNFFDTAGIQTQVHPEGFLSLTEAMSAFLNSGDPLAVLCGSDEYYASVQEMVPTDGRHVLLAGKFELAESLKSYIAIYDCIFHHCDFVSKVNDYLDILGVPK